MKGAIKQLLCQSFSIRANRLTKFCASARGIRSAPTALASNTRALAFILEEEPDFMTSERTSSRNPVTSPRPRVVIVGGGFGGLYAERGLAGRLSE